MEGAIVVVLILVAPNTLRWANDHALRTTEVVSGHEPRLSLYLLRVALDIAQLPIGLHTKHE